MKARSGEKIKMASLEELLGVPGEESSSEVEIRLIHSFKNHPFKVIDDDKMNDLVESIKEHGVLSPVLLRPDGNNTYEMISGHRRLHAAELAGLTTVPAFIRDMTDDESTIIMVDSNIQREELLPSEKAFAYKMKMAAMKRQGARSDLSSCQNGTRFRADHLMSEQFGESARSIQRYIRLTNLIPDLLDMVDKKRLNFTIAVDISYINKDIQTWIYEYIRDNGFIKPNQVAALRKYLEQGTVNQPLMISIFNSCIELKPKAKKITLSEKKLKKYFPPEYSNEEMEQVIENLLENWKRQQEGSR
ncbi:MAG: ParB/RepB/Spo0J family partition protein [Eubacterium sp.]|nr:ParB/RepB/Spo0J family partition protein [Eubacterium sp.]